jgi:DNA-binding HxlR family transcriptional regulator
MIDSLDQEILNCIANQDKKTIQLSEVVKLFLTKKSDRALRERVRHLENKGLVRLKKYPRCVLVTITRKGHEARSTKGGEPR